ncbi:MAG: segregation/condensation protein A [Alphaproteobacteria bacterium]|nr:segregation/condensation protein A [Alphaproteobacteria bacterium]
MNITDFEDPSRIEAPSGEGAFVVSLEGFEGPIDLLLALAREQKVDLAHISILALADQYLSFVTEARRRDLELAADYLVMAAWLAYLKSRLLLPRDEVTGEPSGEELAAQLALRLRRLEAMRGAGARLMARPRLGFDFFGRGAPEPIAPTEKTVIDLTLYELLKSYGDIRRRREGSVLHIEAFQIYTVEDALERLRGIVGHVPDWDVLWRYLPRGLGTGLIWRSAVTSTFAASLELVKQGRIRIRQDAVFGPIYMRAADAAAEPVSNTETTTP